MKVFPIYKLHKRFFINWNKNNKSAYFSIVYWFINRHIYTKCTYTFFRRGTFVMRVSFCNIFMASIKGVNVNYEFFVIIVFTLLLALVVCIVLSKKCRLYCNKQEKAVLYKKRLNKIKLQS